MKKILELELYAQHRAWGLADDSVGVRPQAPEGSL